MLTAAYLRERLDYDPETGRLTWRPKDGSRKDDARWNSRYAGNAAGSLDESEGYLRVKIDGVFYKAHILAWLHFYGLWPEGLVDHRDRDRGHNAIANLRAASQCDNAANASLRTDNTSGHKGVYWNKSRSRWVAQIRDRSLGRQRQVGFFRTKAEAAAAYLAVAKKHFGEFATDGVSV